MCAWSQVPDPTLADFEGVDQDDAGLVGIDLRPDPVIAASSEQVVQVVNRLVRVWDRDDLTSPVASADLGTFFGGFPSAADVRVL